MNIINLALTWLSGKKTYLFIAAYATSKLYEMVSGDITPGQFVDQLLIAGGGASMRAGIAKGVSK